MAIATGLAIGLGVAAAAKTATDIYAAKQGSKAAKEAAQIQTQHADRASRAVDDALMPWVNKGRETASTLGRLTAAPPGARFAAPDPTVGAPRSGAAVPRAGTIGSIGMGQRPRHAAAVGDASSMEMPSRAGTIGGIGTGPMQAPLDLVPMRAPDGSVRPVPSHLVQQFVAKGAVPLEQM